MKYFKKEFHTLNFVIKESAKILLFAHSRPDGDTIGSVLAFSEYLSFLNKQVDIACFDSIPPYLKSLVGREFFHPDQLDLTSYDLIIAADSVERGFNKLPPFPRENQIVTLIDHHPNISIQGDINMIDPAYSSACEIIYNFFIFNKVLLNKQLATPILLGILSDTGSFQHSNTTSRVMEISSDLIKKGASLAKIVQASFSHKNISTLKLWGKAFEKAKINSETGMIVSALTQKDLHECAAGPDDIAQVSGILNTVPGTKFSLVLSEREGGIVKGSLRSEEYKGVDVSKIAAQFGGGGHKLASGFEIKGALKETAHGWEII